LRCAITDMVLPLETFENIFYFLDFPSHAAISLVCRLFKLINNYPRLLGEPIQYRGGELQIPRGERVSAVSRATPPSLQYFTLTVQSLTASGTP
jgi:hypothetical protein